MTHILCMIPQPKDSTSLYRGVGPFFSLARKHNINTAIAKDIDWTSLKMTDLVFFQRPALDDMVQAMKIVRMNSKSIWVDYDDNLHGIPVCNKRYPLYGNPKIQHNIALMVALADVVTVTTNHLAESLRHLLKQFPNSGEYRLDPNKIIVVPNAYDGELQPALEAKPPRSKLVVWRGSDSHSKDLAIHTEEIIKTINVHSDWTYELIGEPFWGTVEAVRKSAKPQSISITSPMDPVFFFDYLNKQKPALVIVPLEDIGFNRSKSNIAWIEATAAGSTVLAPAWEEWNKPGIINYDGIADFGEKFRAFLRGEYDQPALWVQSRDYILENLKLDDVNKRRLAIIESLVK